MMINNFFVLQLLDYGYYNIKGYYMGCDSSKYDSFLETKDINKAKCFISKEEAERIAEHFRGHGKKINVVEIIKYNDDIIDELKIRESIPDSEGYKRSEISYKGISSEHYGVGYSAREKEIFKDAINYQREIILDRFADIFPEEILVLLNELSNKELFYECSAENRPDFEKIKEIREKIQKLIG